jgi:predicted membrane chloride channel (bestrophin family)
MWYLQLRMCAAAAVHLLQMYNWPMLSLQSVQTFFSAITFALTLLLVFKTNSSYARWWEARKDVGQLVSLAHNIVRQVGCQLYTACCTVLSLHSCPCVSAATGRPCCRLPWPVALCD